MGGRQPRLRVPAPARHGRGAVRESGPRAGLSYPHLCACRRPSRPARLSRPAPAGEWREQLLRPPARRRDPHRRGSARRSGREDRGGGRHPPSLDPAAQGFVRAHAREQRRPRPERPPGAGAGRQGSRAAAQFLADAERSRRGAGDPSAWRLRHLVAPLHRGARPVSRQARRPARAGPRHADADLRAGGEEDHSRRARRSARSGRFLPLLRQSGADGPAAVRAAWADGRAQRAAYGRPRRLRLHRALEFPARHLPRPGHRRACGRQCGRRQARLADAGDRRLCRRSRPCGGHSRGCLDPRRRPPRSWPETDGGRAYRRRRLHRLDRDRQDHRSHLGRRRSSQHHPADRGDGRGQRDDRRQHGSARAGGAGRGHLGLPVCGPALLGTAAAGAAGGGRGADAGDADGGDGQPHRRRSGTAADRCRPGDRPAELRQAHGSTRGDEGPHPEVHCRARRGPVRPAHPDPHRPDRGPERGMVRPLAPRHHLEGRRAGRDGEAGEQLRLRPHHGPAQPHCPRR